MTMVSGCWCSCIHPAAMPRGMANTGMGREKAKQHPGKRDAISFGLERFPPKTPLVASGSIQVPLCDVGLGKAAEPFHFIHIMRDKDIIKIMLLRIIES